MRLLCHAIEAKLVTRNECLDRYDVMTCSKRALAPTDSCSRNTTYTITTAGEEGFLRILPSKIYHFYNLLECIHLIATQSTSITFYIRKPTIFNV